MPFDAVPPVLEPLASGPLRFRLPPASGAVAALPPAPLPLTELLLPQPVQTAVAMMTSAANVRAIRIGSLQRHFAQQGLAGRRHVSLEGSAADDAEFYDREPK